MISPAAHRPTNGTLLVAALSTLTLFGCNPGWRSYEVVLRDPKVARIETRSMWEPDPEVPGSGALSYRPMAHKYGAQRGPSGETVLVASDEDGFERRLTLVDRNGMVRILDSGGRVGAGLYLQSARTSERELDLRAWHDVYDHGDIGRAGVIYKIALTTPLSNIARVSEVTERRPAPLLFGLGIAAIITGGGAAIVASDAEDGLRYGVGIPVLSIGALAVAFVGYMLLLPRRTQTERAPETWNVSN